MIVSILKKISSRLMSRARYQLYKGRLKRQLAEADDEGFAQLCWAIDGLQSGIPERIEVAGRAIQYGPAAVVNDPPAPDFVHKWAMETLFNELLVTPKIVSRGGRQRRLNHSHFDGMVPVFNTLRDLEDAEYALRCKPEHVFREMRRAINRQIDWQKPPFSEANLARSLELYGGQRTREYFSESRGLSMSKFVLAGYAAYVHLMFARAFLLPQSVPQLQLTEEEFGQVMNIISLPLERAREEARRIRATDPGRVAYKKSVLRLWPIIRFGEPQRYRAPLMELIWERVTRGLFYDVVSGPHAVRNEISDRFEAYCAELLRDAFPELLWQREEAYTYRGPKRTPDIRAAANGSMKLVLECKAHRMTYGARFGDDPVTEEPRGFDYLANGIFQIWRFMSHVRQSAVPGVVADNGTFGLVLTLDPWMLMSGNIYDTLVEKAHALADAEEGIRAEDRRPVAIASIEDIEALCRVATFESMLRTLSTAASAEFAGYMLGTLHRDLHPDGFGIERENPFIERIDNSLPWWRQIREAEEELER